METIHIDRYDAEHGHGESHDDGASRKHAEQPWYARFMPNDLAVPQSVGEAGSKVASFVKQRPGVAIAAALGMGFLLRGGVRRHPLLKSAFAAFGVPYLRRQFLALR
jgi:hypothetical protein